MERNWIENEAVSPVVAVMLMLVVTIIIAAVVSGYAGGLMGSTNQKAPTLSMDISISTLDTSQGSFTGTITGVSEPIPTKNLKVVTAWTKKISSGIKTGGNITMAGSGVTAPWGFGPGVVGQTNLNKFSNLNATFGNYTLMSGTGLVTSTAQSTDQMNSTLGNGWENLVTGDTVSVNIMHIPTGKTIFQKDVVVTEG